MPPLIDTWTNIPNFNIWPRTNGQKNARIRIYQSVINHLAGKHITNSNEPWRDWLPTELIKKIAKAEQSLDKHGDPVAHLDTSSTAELNNQLKEAAHQSACRPMVIVYERQAKTGYPQAASSWLMLVPSGAQMIIKVRHSANSGRLSGVLKTCFFAKKTARVKNASSRWKATVKGLVGRFGTPTDQGWLHPKPSDKRTIQGQSFRNIRFVSPEHWGFDLDRPGNPYFGRLADWSAIPTNIVPKTRRYRSTDERINLDLRAISL